MTEETQKEPKKGTNNLMQSHLKQTNNINNTKRKIAFTNTSLGERKRRM